MKKNYKIIFKSLLIIYIFLLMFEVQANNSVDYEISGNDVHVEMAAVSDLIGVQINYPNYVKDVKIIALNGVRFEPILIKKNNEMYFLDRSGSNPPSFTTKVFSVGEEVILKIRYKVNSLEKITEIKTNVLLSEYPYSGKIGNQYNTIISTKIVNNSNKSVAKAVYDEGNHFGNINNRGLAVLKGDWIFYKNNDGGLYRIKTDGTQKKKIIADDCYDINVSNGWIYYKKNLKEWSKKLDAVIYEVYKIKFDGSSKTRLFKGAAENLFLLGNNLYFLDYEGSTEDIEGFPICKMSLNGNKNEKLISGVYCLNAFFIKGDEIFYYNQNNFRLYKMKINDADTEIRSINEKIKLRDAYDLIFEGDWIYYLSNLNLYKIKIDGSSNSIICKNVSSFNISKGWIYYSNYNGGLYKIRTDGKSKKILYKGQAISPNIVGDWIYYSNAQGVNAIKTPIIYKIKIDGTKNQKVN